MTVSPEARTAESVPVQLTRMEGDLKLILFQVTDNSRRTGALEAEIGPLKSNVQQLQSDQRAAERAVKDADKAREDTADALEKQNTTAVAKAKDAVDSKARESISVWAPYARIITVLVAFTGVGMLLLSWWRG